MDFATLTFDMCRCYVNDQRKLVGDTVCDQILGWIRSRDISRLSSCPDHIPEALHSRDLCRFTRQIAAFFKKNKAFSMADVCESAASLSFFKAEMFCRQTNKRLDHYFQHTDRLDERLARDIERVQDVIQMTLGDFDEFLGNLPSLIRVTAGATSTRSRRDSLPYLKVSKRGIPATRRAQPYLDALSIYFGYKSPQFRTVFSNRVETVPKNWKTDRTIACEPEGNLFLQLAFDAFVKTKLLKLGVNLSDQSKNQELARLGSIDGDFATIDLSMASDTVAFNTVAWLFPQKWFNYVSAARTPFGVGFGKLLKYAKFSSMGNGSTFAIETLIFAAFCKVCTEGAEGRRKSFAVYGDDLIIHHDFVPRLNRLLQFFGFRVNTEKSYTDPTLLFRESCGTDWYSGDNVTPVYVRCSNPLEIELVHICNTLSGITSIEGELWELLRGLIREHNLPLVPFNQSTISGVWVTAHDAYELKLIHNHHQRLVFKAFVPKTRNRGIYDSRTYFLWHLDAQRRKSVEAIRYTGKHPFLHSVEFEVQSNSECIIRSKVPIFTHKYRRKWVSWFPPAMVTPAHLYWWSDYIGPQETGR
jgi:hypothetical protein